MKRVALLAIIAFAMLHSNAEAKNLSGAEISTMISGKTAYWHDVRGHKTGSITWSTNGSQSIKGDLSQKVKKDTGKWHVSGNKLCFNWKQLTKGKDKCEAVKAVGKNSFQKGGRVFEVK
jgi:ABC-type phosphate transport system substrate-binding protein